MSLECPSCAAIDFLREGGQIEVAEVGLMGLLGGKEWRIHGTSEDMNRLADSGCAVKTGKGFWVSVTCRECGGVVFPGFSCCSVPYA